MKKLILASQSPRRKEILQNAGLDFEVRVAGIEESQRPGEPPAAYVRRLAMEKAEAVQAGPGEVVLAADTVVVVDSTVLGKPGSQSEAKEMLRLLSGREHRVLTGICLRDSERSIVDCVETTVRFMPMSDDEIDWYVTTGEPMDKAGAYAIQGLGSRFIDRIEGCYWNVVGLPLSTVYRYLRTEFGV
jgi:MAF protein